MAAPSISDKDFASPPILDPQSRAGDLTTAKPGEESPIGYAAKSAVVGAEEQLKRNIKGTKSPLGLP